MGPKQGMRIKSHPITGRGIRPHARRLREARLGRRETPATSLEVTSMTHPAKIGKTGQLDYIGPTKGHPCRVRGTKVRVALSQRQESARDSLPAPTIASA